jgi:hypothetical protein
VVEPRTRLAEKSTVVSVLAVQNDHQFSGLVSEHPPDACLMRHVHHGLDAEHAFVPAHARIKVGDGEGKVVEFGLCDRWHEGLHIGLGFKRLG